jgi:PKD repeat protein
VTFTASQASAEAPVLACHWNFGDGSSADGMEVQHAFTHSGEYDVEATASGLDAATSRKGTRVSISGDVPTRFDQANKQRPND